MCVAHSLTECVRRMNRHTHMDYGKALGAAPPVIIIIVMIIMSQQQQHSVYMFMINNRVQR